MKKFLFYTDCKDDNNMCMLWASKGECAKNPFYMVYNCQKSCRVCDGSITGKYKLLFWNFVIQTDVNI